MAGVIPGWRLALAPKCRRWLSAGWAVAVLVPVLVALAANASAQNVQDRAQAAVAMQLSNVHRLLNTSSGAQRVQDSDNELAKNIHMDARQRYETAKAAFEAGDLDEARKLLTEATRSMIMAVRSLGDVPAPQASGGGVAFDTRVESTSVLLTALRRIADEEGLDEPKETVAEVERVIESAKALKADGDTERANLVLRQAYELVKLAVENLRDGRTLVRSLEFANEEEEYRYELDRNDTHQMLVRVVVQNKGPNAQTMTAINAFVEQAQELRREAEAESERGKYGAAIDLLEQSTKELVRAIRRAGIYIPG